MQSKRTPTCTDRHPNVCRSCDTSASRGDSISRKLWRSRRRFLHLRAAPSHESGIRTRRSTRSLPPPRARRSPRGPCRFRHQGSPRDSYCRRTGRASDHQPSRLAPLSASCSASLSVHSAHSSSVRRGLTLEVPGTYSTSDACAMASACGKSSQSRPYSRT